jgi:hypothetical protein
MRCIDCLYNEKCGVDDRSFHAEDSNTCNAFVSLDFNVEYVVIDSDLLDELYMEIADEIEEWEGNLEELWDDSSEWMEMSYMKYESDKSGLVDWDLEETEWENYLNNG